MNNGLVPQGEVSDGLAIKKSRKEATGKVSRLYNHQAVYS